MPEYYLSYEQPRTRQNWASNKKTLMRSAKKHYFTAADDEQAHKTVETFLKEGSVVLESSTYSRRARSLWEISTRFVKQCSK